MKARQEAEGLRKAADTLSERLNQAQSARNVQDLEGEFWHRFIPSAIHWRTGKPIELYEYQRDALRKIWGNQRVLLHWGRQCGKTVTVALFLAFLSRWKTNQQFLVLSFREDQSKLLLRYVRFFLLRHLDRAYRENVEFASVKHLQFRNGTRIDAMPSGQVSRGYAADVFVLDESELVSDDDLSAILPTKLATESKQVFLGTSWSVDNFWYSWTTKPDEFGFAYSRMTSVDAQIPNGPIRAKDLSDLRRELEGPRFDQECLLLPLSAELRWFPTQLLAKVFTGEPYLPVSPELQIGGRLFVGFDPATAGRDESVAYPLLLLRDGSVEDLPVLGWHNTPAPVQVLALKEFARKHEGFSPLFIVDQTSAFGIAFCDLLLAANLQFQPFTFSSQSKALLYTKGRNALEELQSVKLRDQRTKHQLGVYRFRESESVKGRFRFGQPNIPDDRADALMLALWGLSQPHAYFNVAGARRQDSRFFGDRS